MKINQWLTDKDFINNSPYPNKYFLKQVGYYVNEYIKDIPIPVITTFDTKNFRIYFIIGNDKTWFELDEDVSYHDFITLIDRGIQKFFPQYRISYKETRTLNDEEIFEKVKGGVSLDDACVMEKEVDVVESGIIKRITLKKDQFIFERDGHIQIRGAGAINMPPITLSEFLKTIRRLESGKEVRDYILKNSTQIKDIDKGQRKIHIEYTDSKMKNFFIINFPDLHTEELEKVGYLNYNWGRFDIHFNNENIEEDCLKFVRESQKEKGL